MWKPLTLCAALVASGPVLAGTINLHIDNEEQCNADLHHQLRVGPDFMIAYPESKDSKGSEPLFTFHAPDQLTVDGRTVTLNSEQQALMQRYRSETHTAGHDLATIALDAVEIALQGVNVALSTLAGVDHPDALEVQEMSADIHRRAKERFSAQGNVYTLGESEIEGFIEEAVENDLEPRLEELATKSAGTIAWHALKAAFTGGRSIEADAEEAAETVERVMENKAEKLERRAHSLCQQLQIIDQTEREVHASIPGLAAFDIVSVE